MFKVNEAGWDRVLRVVLGIVMLVLGWGGYVTGPLGVFLQWFGLIPLITGLLGWCAIYALLGMSTRKTA